VKTNFDPSPVHKTLDGLLPSPWPALCFPLQTLRFFWERHPPLSDFPSSSLLFCHKSFHPLFKLLVSQSPPCEAVFLPPRFPSRIPQWFPFLFMNVHNTIVFDVPFGSLFFFFLSHPHFVFFSSASQGTMLQPMGFCLFFLSKVLKGCNLLQFTFSHIPPLGSFCFPPPEFSIIPSPCGWLRVCTLPPSPAWVFCLFPTRCAPPLLGVYALPFYLNL